ncbi:12321_t:CDS:2, partial [Acaulospora colombiana]
LKAKNNNQVLEWIPYNRFRDLTFVARGGFASVYYAIWVDGFIRKWDHKEGKWERKGRWKVALKVLDCSNKVTPEFFAELYETFYRWYWDLRDGKVTPVSTAFIAADDNMPQPDTPASSRPVTQTHPLAIYTSRLLNFSNLPEPVNAPSSQYGRSSTTSNENPNNRNDEETDAYVTRQYENDLILEPEALATSKIKDEEVAVVECCTSSTPIKKEFETKAVKRELEYIEIKDEDDHKSMYPSTFLYPTTVRPTPSRRNHGNATATAPHRNTQDWTEAEDYALLSGIQTHGGKWSIICREIDTGRTPVQCFRRWNKMEVSLNFGSGDENWQSFVLLHGDANEGPNKGGGELNVISIVDGKQTDQTNNRDDNCGEEHGVQGIDSYQQIQGGSHQDPSGVDLERAMDKEKVNGILWWIEREVPAYQE